MKERRTELEATYKEFSNTKLKSFLRTFLDILRESVKRGDHSAIDYSKEVLDVIKEERARRREEIRA